MAEGPPTPGPEKPADSKRDMRTMLLSIIAVAIIIGIVVLVLLLSGSVCPSCDDSNPCTEDSCDEKTGECIHSPLSGSQEGCSGDVGACKFRTCEDGMCVEKVKDECCGNGICEEGETYENCEEDCLSPLIENCSDGIDNDGDGLIDCDDPDCECEEAPVENDTLDCCDPNVECTESVCDDGIDYDCDGLIDCDDPDCAGTDECPVDCEDLILINEFADEFGRSVMDDEEDDCEDIPQGEWRGKVNEVGCHTHDNEHFNCNDLESEVLYAQFKDFCEEDLLADWECQSNYWGCLCNKEPPEELEPETGDNCDDGIDNDGDGLIDCMDPECCPPEYSQDSGDQCCCEDFFDTPEWISCWPDCEDCFCYGDEICEEVEYIWGFTCECVEEDEGPYCEDLDYVNVDRTCPDYPCHDSSKKCRPRYVSGGLICECVDNWGQEGDNCDDKIDNDNDGLIDCMDPDCCPAGMDQCCCEDFFNMPSWVSCWPYCEDCFCYDDDICYDNGYDCQCLEEPPEIECESIQNPNSQADCDPGYCYLPGDPYCLFIDNKCECRYDCSGGEDPNANYDQYNCEYWAWCMDYGMGCWWYVDTMTCACPLII